MAEVGIRALKQNASAVIADAVRGELITVTDRGRPVARIARIPTSALELLIDSGRARSPRRALADLPAPDPGPGLSDELRAMRNDVRY